MELEKLIEQNPWWRDPSSIKLDMKFREAQNAEFTWEPRMIAFIGLDKDAIYTLRGPRQVGKTTFLKFLIEKVVCEIGFLHVRYGMCYFFQAYWLVG